MTIGEILTKHGSDKDSCHHYGPTYEAIFKSLPEDLTILEIGVQSGASLKAWREYRPKSVIHGVDIQPVETEDHFYLGDIKALPRLQEDFDLIIDDGSHQLSDLAFVVENYIKHRRAGGVMVLEDIRHPEWETALRATMLEHVWPLAQPTLTMIKTGEGYDDRLIIIK